MTSTVLACVVPSGSGIGWRLVVVNHDELVESPGASPGTLSPTRWRTSAHSAHELSYRTPVITAMAPLGSGSMPAAGGFLLAVNGTDFSALFPPIVLVGSQTCPVVADSFGHTGLVCTAPPRQVDTNSRVVVHVDGQSSAPAFLQYDPPVVTAVTPTIIDALATSQRQRITLRGRNFGVRYRDGMPSNHTLRIGSQPCGSVVWASDVEVSCTPGADVEWEVGTHDVVLAVAGDASAPVPVPISCPPETYGRPGQRCSPCPQGARCDGRDADPVALAGWYPVGLAQFVPCTPPNACVGGVAVTAINNTSDTQRGCSRNYAGLRCAECAMGAYRLRSKCTKCPNTAWLLLLLFSLAILTAVTAAVHLSKKRINMAGLSVGVVSGCRCP
jgi:hypothetical protein